MTQEIPQDIYSYYPQDLAALIGQIYGANLNNDQFYAQLGLDRDMFNAQVEQWQKQFGLTKNQAIAAMLMQQQQATGYMQTQPYLDADGNVVFGEGTVNTIPRDVANWNYELGKGGLGLNYLQLLASQSGPQDWLNYARTVRGAEGTGLPVWAEALMNGYNLPAFGGAYQANQLSPIYDQFLGPAQGGAQAQNSVTQNAGVSAMAQNEANALMQQAYANAMANGYSRDGDTGFFDLVNEPGAVFDPSQAMHEPGRVAPSGQQRQQWALPSAQKVTAARWNQFLPFEQQMYMGAVGAAGQDPETYLTQMQRSWGAANRKLNPTTYWR